jgi:F-type H+-transporting ATPase subunit a
MEVHVSIAAETLFYVGPVPITNSFLTMLIVMAFIIIAGTLIARRARLVPSGRAQGLAELIVEFLLSLVESTAGKAAGRRIFPLIAGIFIFILFANYSGLFPGVGTIGIYVDEPAAEAELDEPAAEEEVRTVREVAQVVNSSAVTDVGTLRGAQEEPVEEEHAEEEAAHHTVLVPLFRAPTADLNMTLAMALVTFSAVQILGVGAHGVVGRIKHMADPWWIFPLELVQEFARIVSLSFRLFGNVFAGEVLLAVMIGMANAIKIAVLPLLFPVVFLFLEVLFGTIQALVFALLTLIYITLATAGGHDEAHHAAEHAHPVEPARPVTSAAAGD